MTNWTDAHCHLQDEFLSDGDHAALARATLDRAYEVGVDRVVVVGTGAQTSREALLSLEPRRDLRDRGTSPSRGARRRQPNSRNGP